MWNKAKMYWDGMTRKQRKRTIMFGVVGVAVVVAVLHAVFGG